MDWQAKGAVTQIKDQGECGSCWSFSTTGSLESAHFLSTGNLTTFSEQQLVDCTKNYDNNGCKGGWVNTSFLYVVDHGIALESRYPYEEKKGTCRYNESTDKAWTITNCTEVTRRSEQVLMKSIVQQPVSVGIEANRLSFQLYKKGVYTSFCGYNVDHSVLAVGYGVLDEKKHYKVKNSWGTGWGDKGYIYIERTG